MPKRIDLTGQVFGRLTVVTYSHSKVNAYWKCLCECGEYTVVASCTLKSGHTTSCGCYQRETATSHGMCGSSEYSAWNSILQRCNNPSSSNYSRYGRRGITVCESWLKFENFYKDMGPRPSKDHSIDRIDNDGPYCKDNCRWATRKEQQNNQRSNKMLTHNGETKTMSQWAEETGIPHTAVWGRVRLGWSVEKALTTPVRIRRKGGE